MYWKKIVYLDYLEYGEKVKNVGHVKLFRHHDVLSLDVHLKGLYETDSLLTELTGITFQKEVKLGRLCVDKGCCYYSREYPADNIDGNGLEAGCLTGICIRLSENRNVTALWEEKEEVKPAARENIVYYAEENSSDNPIEKEPVQEPMAGKAAEMMQMTEEPEPAVPSKDKEPVYHTSDKIYEDKWQQLCHNYQVVHPFGEEEYISLAPKDFVILRQEYQQLVNNSFLLHGYYNYRHLILGKIRNDTEGGYYLGVPGTYHERERMVAVMFGFEGFESAAENIESGTFGYYMRRVQL